MRGDEADFSGAAAEIEDGLAGAQIFAGIAAAVIALDDFLRDDFEILGVVFDRAAKFRFGCLGARRIAFTDFGFGVDGAHALWVEYVWKLAGDEGLLALDRHILP